MSVKCLIYCTKSKPYISYDSYDNKIWETDREYSLNGKIVAQFDCEKIEEIENNLLLIEYNFYVDFKTKSLCNTQLYEKSCLCDKDLLDYLLYKNGYAIHISNLKIFDKPLSFKTDYIYKDYKTNAILTKAPQNMCNVYDRFGNHYVLISIKPEYVAKILNGEKTIEVRRKILNCLKDLI